jgi:hypothetical protein
MGIPTYFPYAPRRVECAEHGVVEHIRWSDGKRPVAYAMPGPSATGLRFIAFQAGQALHGLDRKHIAMQMNQALDQVQRAESTRLRSKGKDAAQRLKYMRWPLSRRGGWVRGHTRQKPDALLASKRRRSWPGILKESFLHFLHYKSPV